MTGATHYIQVYKGTASGLQQQTKPLPIESLARALRVTTGLLQTVAIWYIKPRQC